MAPSAHERDQGPRGGEGGRGAQQAEPRGPAAWALKRRRRGRGALKKKLTDLGVCSINSDEPTNPKIFCFLTFVLVRFWAFLSKGSSKTRLKKLQTAKSPCRKPFPRKFSENRQKLRCQFFLNFFGFIKLTFIAFSGVTWRWEFKNTTKNVLQKTSCRKVFTKKSTKNPKPIFPRLFYHVFGRFSVR
jgi:hypothetical protein